MKVCAFCTSFEKASSFFEEIGKKLSTHKNFEKAVKSSYSRIYSHYPHGKLSKKKAFWRKKEEKDLVDFYKKHQKLKKTGKTIDTNIVV